MESPLASVIVPTYGRADRLPRAVESVLAQTLADVEVVVVDDGSDPPVEPPADARVRLVRRPANGGLAAALNDGAHAARGRFVAHLADDDELLPHMLEVSLDAHARACETLAQPVAVLSAIVVVDGDGNVLGERHPPTLPRGCHYSLEGRPPGTSFETRNTMVVEREVLASVGYWDEAFRASVRHELFLRLNPVCSIAGVPVVTYRKVHHRGYRLSADTRLKHESFVQLAEKHRDLFEAHPRRYSAYLVRDAARLLALRRPGAAARTLARAVRVDPATAGRRVLGVARARSAYALRERRRRWRR